MNIHIWAGAKRGKHLDKRADCVPLPVRVKFQCLAAVSSIPVIQKLCSMSWAPPKACVRVDKFKLSMLAFLGELNIEKG